MPRSEPQPTRKHDLPRPSEAQGRAPYRFTDWAAI
ncbi:hypothetical protein TL5118_02177 [Thalassovita autumnalis]|uniref:Uncharacterized protein n=1 Tax=Thalassovita autumnalis TaxID=2072972 RepID=A0A0P1FY87_9RHOB|nr:hypothetical protein TL5118_02177 [Thalassovita autumnalis]CUH73875.1 hypothetical protein TL5120_03692 [Thalassovita autumnalis]